MCSVSSFTERPAGFILSCRLQGLGFKLSRPLTLWRGRFRTMWYRAVLTHVWLHNATVECLSIQRAACMTYAGCTALRGRAGNLFLWVGGPVPSASPHDPCFLSVRGGMPTCNPSFHLHHHAWSFAAPGSGCADYSWARSPTLNSVYVHELPGPPGGRCVPPCPRPARSPVMVHRCEQTGYELKLEMRSCSWAPHPVLWPQRQRYTPKAHSSRARREAWGHVQPSPDNPANTHRVIRINRGGFRPWSFGAACSPLYSKWRMKLFRMKKYQKCLNI